VAGGAGSTSTSRLRLHEADEQHIERQAKATRLSTTMQAKCFELYSAVSASPSQEAEGEDRMVKDQLGMNAGVPCLL
jgi:hypothetical protein